MRQNVYNIQNRLMIFWAILILLIVSLAYSYYFYKIKPGRTIKWYRDTFEALGYNILVFPYHPFRIMHLENQRHNEKEYGDAYHDEKHVWKHYDLVISNVSNKVTIFLINPRLLKHFFANGKEKNFIRSHVNKYGFKMVLGNSLVLNQGLIWKHKRKVISEVFNFDLIKRNFPKMKDICSLYFDRVEQQMGVFEQSNTTISYKLELLPIFEDIISTIVIKCFLGGQGIDVNVDGMPIYKYISEVMKEAKKQSTDYLILLLGEKPYNWGLLPKYRKLKAKIARVKKEVKSIIDKRLGEIKQANPTLQRYTDILQAMYALNAKEIAELKPLKQEQIIQEFCAFMTAGNDLTSLFTNMVLYYLCQNPAIELKLRQELSKCINDESQITFSNVKNVVYLDWVQLETTRLYGPATSIFLREAAVDTCIDNVPILKGTGLKIELLANHYNQSNFENPQQFNPERWRETDPKPFTFGGFGFGARTCLGKHLAYMSSKVVIVMLLQRYSRIQIDKSSKIHFQARDFYAPSPFQSIVTKRKKELVSL